MLARLIAAARPRVSSSLARHRDEVLDVARRNCVRRVRVFGSVARGDDTADSDLDLLVEFAPDASLLDQSGLAQELQRLLGVRVDVVSEGGLTQRDGAIRAEAVPL